MLQTLRLVVLLEKTCWLRFNGLMRWLTLLALQALGLVALLAKTGLLRFESLLTFNGLTSSQTLLA